uniref:Fatty acid desaturase domain-containing protein n=1 Tax=Phlebotomus papatasi TaxID=29031 RepID=A0A1B0CZP4_PHLPP
MTARPHTKESEIKSAEMQPDLADTLSGQDEISNRSGDAFSVQEFGTDFKFKHKIVWENALAFLVFHIVGLIGLVEVLTLRVSFLTTIYTYLVLWIGGIGLTVGGHRYFTHRTFKANKIMRRVLMFLFVLNGQNSLWEWVRDHRQHHKYSDTDADPHNASRGFFFSHVGWLMSKKHPKVIEIGKGIDMSDIEADSWIMFQKKYFLLIYSLISIVVPTIIPILLWNEDPIRSFIVCYVTRTTIGLNFTWFVNSLAHLYGTRPYDKTILPVQSRFVSFCVLGEGWHNYHHAFPWDYKISEYGHPHNFAATIIEYCAKKGWAYDLKSATEESIKNRVERTGDNSHDKYGDPDNYDGWYTWKDLWKSPYNPSYSSKLQPKPVRITRPYILHDTEKSE